MEYQEFEKEIFALTGIELRLYKEKQMKRRLEALIKRLKKEGFEDYLHYLKDSADARKQFLDYITINVTDFFRNPDHWLKFEETALPKLTNGRAWCVACSTGQEAYSIVMTLAKRFPLEEIRVLATDIDDKVLEIARKGVYTEEEMLNVPYELKEKYFIRTGKVYRVCDAICNCVEFKKMNLLADAFPKEMNLVVCRNVLIYFKDEVKQKCYPAFRECLTADGVLFTGQAEQVLQYKMYGYNKICSYLYCVKG